MITKDHADWWRILAATGPAGGTLAKACQDALYLLARAERAEADRDAARNRVTALEKNGEELLARAEAAEAELRRISAEIEAERTKTREAEGATARDEGVLAGVFNGLGIALRIVRGES